MSFKNKIYLILFFSLFINHISWSQECHSAYSEDLGLSVHNFGVVKYNHFFQIYRSNALGETLAKLSHKIESRGYKRPKTIIYLHQKDFKFRSQEQNYTKRFVNIKFIWSEEFTFSGHPKIEDEKNIIRILNIILSSEMQPILFHCKGGRHRTGMIALILRYLEGGCWIDKSVKKKVWVGRKIMTMNRAEFEYYQFNKIMFRNSNLEFVRKFSQSTSFLKIQRKYQEKLKEVIENRSGLSQKLEQRHPIHDLIDFLYKI